MILLQILLEWNFISLYHNVSFYVKYQYGFKTKITLTFLYSSFSYFTMQLKSRKD